MKKYLAILDFDSGIAQLDNVAVLFAKEDDSIMDLKIRWAKEMGLTTDGIMSALSNIKLWDLSEIQNNWSYYEN